MSQRKIERSLPKARGKNFKQMMKTTDLEPARPPVLTPYSILQHTEEDEGLHLHI
jgi:hypothetical protein